VRVIFESTPQKWRKNFPGMMNGFRMNFPPEKYRAEGVPKVFTAFFSGQTSAI
jgi:hypothetical protein